MQQNTPQPEYLISLMSAQSGHFPPSSYTTTAESHQIEPTPAGEGQFSMQEGAVASVGVLLIIAVWHFVTEHLKRRKADEGAFQAHQEGISKAKRLTHHLPCTRCHYFKANMYLPCAVNPMVVLKPEAKDCTDFRDRESSETTEAIG